MSVFVSKRFSSYPTNGTCAIRKNNTLNRCTNKCTTGVPCQYLEELDFRIIVLTFNRPDSLRKCLSHIAKLDTLGHEVGVDIWIDRSKEGKLDEDTYEISSEFQDTWTCGQVCLHIQDRNAYIIGQWVDAWRPRENTREIALILEDDIDISPLTYKWLKMVDSHFRTVPDIAGYTLQGESVNYIKDKIRPVTNTPKTDNVFIYRLMGTWGFSPKPKEWRDFQDWFHETQEIFTQFIPTYRNIQIEVIFYLKQIEEKQAFISVRVKASTGQIYFCQNGAQLYALQQELIEAKLKLEYAERDLNEMASIKEQLDKKQEEVVQL
ncbi:hypothetical protein LSH36_1267g00028 [Paralvinella palmiformis]|uniref:Uncharacterized protein n=1 Tax=Paralvinella palmiformis TaxID=53620 RepID=A0AAD9IU86_9ANNE|nr:hypothetical protein LSH36_1267g00028 [Paralvinella palmiformis]